MTPAQKIKIGKAVADDLGKRYKFTQSEKPEATLSDILKQGKPIYPKGLDAFLDRSNPLYQKFERVDVLRLLVEKGAIEKVQIEEHMKQQSELFQSKEAFDNLANAEIQQTVTENMEKEVFNLYETMVLNTERNRPINFMSFLSFLVFKKEEGGEGAVSSQQCKVLSELEKLEDKQVAIEERINELEERFLKGIEEKWRSGELKHALLNHAPKQKKRKTTLARAVPVNQVYTEQMKKQIEDEDKPYSATDITGLDKITAKQFQALQFLAHKAQNQTAEEKKVLKLWDEVAGETHRGFRVVAFKESEYITHSQGKESAIVSNKEKTVCMNAIDEIKDITFTIRWEEKLKGEKEYLLYQHALIKTLNPKHPWTLVKEEKDRKEIKRFRFIAIPERLFEYKEIKDKEDKYKGAKILFDVINIDPDFFTKLKYSDPEIQHVSDALMKLSLMFLIEGSFLRTEFMIDEDKLLKRIGLIADNERHKARAKKTLDIYLKKLINHGTLETEEKKDQKRVFKFPKKGKDFELK